jgi:hypothetical protein
VWYALRPPPPPDWHFTGEVTDRITSMPIPGVEVDVMNGDAVEKSGDTDAQGHFDLELPPPKPPYVNVRFRKDGYEFEAPFNVITSQPFNQDMTKVRSK